MTAIENREQVPNFQHVTDIDPYLRHHGCRMCDLGFQKDLNGCCVMRGTVNNKMIVGESPGKEEDSKGQPFTGPAGRLMDKIWASVGMDTNDWYLTNVVKCRPIAPYGSGKQNLTPKVEQRQRCKPFLDAEIRLLKPRIIITVGGTATAALTGAKSVRIGEMRGKLTKNLWPPEHDGSQLEYLLFPMLHPAAILHASRDPEKHLLYRRQTWDDIQRLKEILTEESLL